MHSPPPTKLRRLGARIGFDRDWYLVLIAAVIGVGMSGVAIAFILPLRWMEHFAAVVAVERPPLHWWLVPLMPVAGAFLAGWVMQLFGEAGRGPGVAAVMYAIHRGKAKIGPGVGVRKWITASLTIGSGGSAGAEGPIVTIGSSLGSWVAQLLRTTPQNRATLLGCAAAAGMASVFNAPIAGIFFVLEILLRDFSLRTFTPIVIASVISAGSTQAILHKTEPLFSLGSDFSQDAFALVEIPNYFVLGILCGLGAVVFIRALYFTEDRFSKLRIHPALRPALGALLLGLLGLGYVLLIQRGAVPAFYGNGYAVIERLTSLDYYYADEAHTTLRPAASMLVVLVALGLFKGVATSLTVGSGGAGGLFAPSLLIGAAAGGTFGYIVNMLGWFPSATPAHYAVVGMASMVAATTHAPLTAILIVYEITRSYEIILPLMFTAVISTVVGRLILRDSIYGFKLARMGVQIGGMSDLTILRRLSVEDVPLERPVLVRPEESAQRLLDLAEEGAASDFVVVDDRRHYVGMVTGADLRAALVYREAVPLLQVSELQRSDLPVVSPVETLDVVLEKFSRYDVQCLAVIDESGDGAVLGLITRARLMQLYQTALRED